MSNLCNSYSSNCLERYKYLAKLEYKHRLMGKISKCLIHDISTPLSILSGSLKILEDPKSSNKEISNVRKSAFNSLLYLENILDNTFLLLRDSCKEGKFFPNTSVKQVLSLLESKIKKGNIVLKKHMRGNTKLDGNHALFSRAVLNVLVNSIEELEKVRYKRKIIEITSYSKNSMYYLSIKDNGRGIRKDILEKIRNKEFTMKDNSHLGLGLHFVRDTVENHFNGFLQIESKKGNSTTIVFKIPY
jgi:signal transduction histidine kinase